MKIFGIRGFDAVSKDLKQLHLCNTFETLKPLTPSKEEYNEFLESHRFLKDNIYKTVKGSMLAVANKQRGAIDKEYAAYPTADLRSVLLIPKIELEEGNDV